jgi:hypothetical protein
MGKLAAAIEVMVFIGVYMKWIRPIVDKIFNIDAPPSYLDSPEEQKRKSKKW